MNRRESADRRASRLAFLLAGGDAALTARILTAILLHAPDLGRVDAARLDRVCITAARRVLRRTRPLPPVQPDMPPERVVLHATLAMPQQLREAWLLTRIDDLDSVAVARAMDSSRTAAARHLERAEALMASLLATLAPAPSDAISQLRTALAAIDCTPIVKQARDRHRRQQRLRLSVLTLGGIVIGVVVAAVVFQLMRK